MPRKPRNAKGTNFVEIVKTLRVHRRTTPIQGLSKRAAALLDERILPTNWYPLEPLIEILEYAFVHLLESDTRRAYEFGVVGATAQLTGVHRAFVVRGDPRASVMSLRHIWRSYFDFGELKVTEETPTTALFRFNDYPDMPCMQGFTLPAWEVVAAKLAGSQNPGFEMLECPWHGAPALVYRISF